MYGAEVLQRNVMRDVRKWIDKVLRETRGVETGFETRPCSDQCSIYFTEGR
jgi:hypothetical protein